MDSAEAAWEEPGSAESEGAATEASARRAASAWPRLLGVSARSLLCFALRSFLCFALRSLLSLAPCLFLCLAMCLLHRLAPCCLLCLTTHASLRRLLELCVQFVNTPSLFRDLRFNITSLGLDPCKLRAEGSRGLRSHNIVNNFCGLWKAPHATHKR